MAELIDLSQFQPVAQNYVLAKAAGIEGIYAKATDGLGSPDPHFLGHVEHAHAAGLPVGAYHFLRVRTGRPQDAAAQAEEFCTRYLGAGCELLPALDAEDTTQQGRSPSEWLDALHTFIGRSLVLLGFEPMLYTYPWFWRSLGSLIASSSDLAKCPLWMADYSNHPAPIVLAPFEDWVLWQYTDKGSVSGLSGPVDRSRSKGPIDTLRRPPSTPPAA